MKLSKCARCNDDLRSGFIVARVLGSLLCSPCYGLWNRAHEHAVTAAFEAFMGKQGIRCPLCGEHAVEEWGESGAFWLHCNACGEDDPVIKAASKALAEKGEVSLSVFAGIPHEHYLRICEVLTNKHRDLAVHLVWPEGEGS